MRPRGTPFSYRTHNYCIKCDVPIEGKENIRCKYGHRVRTKPMKRTSEEGIKRIWEDPVMVSVEMSYLRNCTM